MGANLIHPCESLQLVVSHSAIDHAFWLLGHVEIVLAQGLAIQTTTNTAQDLSFIGQDVAKCRALLQEVIEFSRFGLTLLLGLGLFLLAPTEKCLSTLLFSFLILNTSSLLFFD